MRRQGLAAKGVFDGFVNGFYIDCGGVGRDLVQRLVKLRTQRISRNRTAYGDLRKRLCNAIERRSGLNLRQAKVDFRRCGFSNFVLLHVAYDAHNTNLGEAVFAHRQYMSDWIPDAG